MILYALIAYVSAYHSIILILQSRFYRKLIKVLFSFVRLFTFCSCHSCDIVSSATNIYIIMLSSSTEKVIIFDSVKKNTTKTNLETRSSRVQFAHGTAAAVVWLPSILEERGISQKTLVARAGYAREGYTLTLAYSRWTRKKSPINNYGELGFVVAFHRSLLIRLDYSSSETVDVMTIIILSIIEYLLLFSIFWYNNDPLL